MSSNQGRHPLKKTSAVLFILCLLASPCQATDSLIVARVIDRDTLLLSNREKARLIGVDIPGSKDHAKLRREAKRTGQDADTIIKRGEAAAEFTRKLVEGKLVRLEYDVQKKDKHGRALAYVYVFVCSECESKLDRSIYEVTEFKEGIYIFLNATLIKSGNAQVKTVQPNVKYQDLFMTLQRDARKNERGLWKIPPDLKMTKNQALVLAEEFLRKAGEKWRPETLMANEYSEGWSVGDKDCEGNGCLRVLVDKRTKTVKFDDPEVDGNRR
ncbi:MAG: thermonuclease family protein [Candidatus Omnitrophota bacterium]